MLAVLVWPVAFSSGTSCVNAPWPDGPPRGRAASWVADPSRAADMLVVAGAGLARGESTSATVGDRRCIRPTGYVS